MKNLNFKTKILLLVLTPLILVSIALTILAIYQANALGEQNIQSFSQKIYDLRRNELKNYTEMALSSVKHIYNSKDKNSPQAQEQAKNILRDLAYGSDGYIFVYDYDGTNLVLPTKPQIEGKNLWDIKDKNGVFLIKELVANAKIGGGYTNYVWDKPSKGRDIDKISYAMGLDDWSWMLGTGLYVDDLNDAIAGVQDEVNNNLSRTWQFIAGLALSCTIIVGLIGTRFTLSQGKLADEQLQKLSIKVVAGQDDERARVARELQQTLNHKLQHARSQLKDMYQSNIITDPGLLKNLTLAAKDLNHSIKEIYRISGDLRPQLLDEQGIDAAIEGLIHSEELKATDISVEYRHNGLKTRLRLEIETNVYRIIQEALKNVINHSHAENVAIRLSQQSHHISVSIKDDGIGFNIKEMTGKGNKAGLGLIDMRIRAESLGGTFNIFTFKEGGTMLKIDIPS
jgi:two-component system NarL family sensor kinase